MINLIDINRQYIFAWCLVRNDMDVNENERLSKITDRHEYMNSS
jgi:hypothetical protein